MQRYCVHDNSGRLGCTFGVQKQDGVLEKFFGIRFSVFGLHFSLFTFQALASN